MKGFVYVLSNASMPGLIKVGMTTKVPDGRAKELSSDTSTPTPFIVEYYALFDDMEKAESLSFSNCGSALCAFAVSSLFPLAKSKYLGH